MAVKVESSPAKLLAERVHGHRVGEFHLYVAEARPIRPRAGWLYLTVKLADRRGTVSRTPIMTGIVSGGGRGVKPWFECRLFPEVEFGPPRVVDARGRGLEAAVVELLGALVPPGGHLMLDYETRGQEQTFSELARRVPPAATYLGSLMFRAGCRGEFKDWYFSEGGHEGPRKLQANKSPDSASARRALRNHLRALRAFLRSPTPSHPGDAAIVARAKKRARSLIKSSAAGASP